VSRSCAARTDGTFASYRPANFIHATLHDGETQSGPSRPGGEEWLEDFIQLIFSDTAPMIFHQEFRILLLALQTDYTNLNHAALSAGLHGIDEKVRNNVTCSFPSAFNQARAGVDDIKGNAAPIRIHSRDGGNPADDGR
jgi:hypothetical protein